MATRGWPQSWLRLPAGFSSRGLRRAAAPARHPILVSILGCILLPTAFGQVEEYTVKAAFIYNFAKFVEWPAQAFHGPGDPISICVLGQNPFGHSLDDVVRGQAVNGRAFRVRQIPEVSSKTACHILFVSAAERKRYQSEAAELKGIATLTIGESRGFAAEGGIVNFKLEDGKVRFEINLDAAEQAQIRISSKLLSLADLVPRNARTR